MLVEVYVSNQKLKVATNNKDFVSGTKNFVQFKFILGDDWDGMTTLAQFAQGGRAYNIYLDNDNCCYLPEEIIAGECTMLLYGVKTNVIATTNYLQFMVHNNGFITDSIVNDITQSLYEQLVGLISNKLTDAPANGNLYGRKDNTWCTIDLSGVSSSGLSLGTTSNTAYRGDYGAAAYAHGVTNKGSAFSSGLYKITTNSEGHVTSATAVQKSDITSLGIPGSDTNTTYSVATSSANGLMSSADKTKLDNLSAGANNYVHPSYTSKSSGLYKVTVDSTGHVSNATAVTKSDITSLGVPSSDTTYSVATTSSNGLMSSTDKAKLDGMTSGGGGSYVLPVASSSTLGGIKVGSNLSISDGVLSATDTNTWRGIQDNLTSDSATDSLSAKQGKALKSLVDGKASSSHTHSGYESSSNKVTSISSSSTDTQYPSAKAVYTAISNSGGSGSGSCTPTSHSDGGTVTGSEGSFAIGKNTTVGGDSAFASGYSCTANGDYTHAEGIFTNAYYEGSHAEGYCTWAYNDFSHAEGLYTSANGQASHAEGQCTIAQKLAQHVSGKWNIADNDDDDENPYGIYAYIIGNGDDDDARSNAFAVKWDASVEFGDGSETSEINAFAHGYGCTASGINSHAEGYNTIASEANAHSEGSNTTASGIDCHAEGYNTISCGYQSHAEGYGSYASGSCCHADGYNTSASGYCTHTEGSNTSASGTNSHAEGLFTIASGSNQHVFGQYNVSDGSADTYSIIVGNGSSTSSRRNAYTLDWNGNGIYSGKLTVGSAPTNNMDVATKQYVDTLVGDIESALAALR